MKDYSPTNEAIACFPLYTSPGPAGDAVDFVGTATLIQFNSSCLIATAAHVIDHGRALHLRGQNQVLEIGQRRWVSRVRPGLTRETDPIDLGVVQLNTQEKDILSSGGRFIDFRREALLDIPATACLHKIDQIV